MPGLIPDGYVFDTCAIIDLFGRYPPRTFATVWRNLDRLAREGRLKCPAQVLAELKRKEDDAYAWLEDRKTLIVRREDPQVWGIGQHIMATHRGLVDTTRTGPQADPFVIALARSLRWTVVTSERTKGFGSVNIPSVCKELGVRCQTLLEFFEAEGWRL